jgi:hypothetical protein
MPPWAYAPAYAVLPQPVPFLQPVPSGVTFPAGLAPQPDRAPPAPAAPARSDDADPYVEIRDGLREVRGALHDLASRRARRRA